MKIIFAQGNPDDKYASTRHNVGFYFIDELAKKYQVEFTKKPKFHGDIAEITKDGEKILLVKPTTFYNETGQSARLLIDFYKLNPAEDFLVIHDDLALPFGTIRTRKKGSDAGNNGIKSLNAHLGVQYPRIRIGIYNDERDQIDDANFVLSKFKKSETETLQKTILPKVDELITTFISGNHVADSHTLQEKN